MMLSCLLEGMQSTSVVSLEFHFYAIKKQVSFSIPADYLLYYVQRIFTMHSLSGCSTFHQRNRKYCLGWNYLTCVDLYDCRDCLLRHLFYGLMNGSQSGTGKLCNVHIIESYDLQSARDFDIQIITGLQYIGTNHI